MLRRVGRICRNKNVLNQWQHFRWKSGKKGSPILEETGAVAAVKDAAPEQQVYVLPRPKYGGRHSITLLTGSSLMGEDGARYITSLLSASRVPIEIDRIAVKNKEEYFKSVLRNRAAVHIDIDHSYEEKAKSRSIASKLDLYASLIKMHSFEGFNCRFPGLDLVLIGQNNIGDFSKLEYAPVPGVAETLRVVTEDNITRFLCFVFSYTRIAKRKSITIAHKCAEQPKSDGKFLEIAMQLQKHKYSDIDLNLVNLEKFVTDLLSNPKQLDVVCASDRYFTFIATICSAVCGGANLFSALDIGDHHAIFKPLQTKLSLTNFQSLSPYGIIATVRDLLQYLGYKECADQVWNELLRTMCQGIKTADFGGRDSGNYVVCNIMNRLHCKFFG